MPETLSQREVIAVLERRAKQAEALIQVSSGVRYDQPLEDVLGLLAANIAQHTRASSVATTLLHPADLSSIAYGEVNVPAGYTDAMIALRQQPGEAAQLRTAVAEGRTWVLRDARNSMLARPAYAPMYDMIRAVSWATVVGTAFAYRPEAIAVVYLCYDADVDVDDEEVSFARAIAFETAPAMDNAWLFSEVKRRASELDALARADAAMHESLRLRDALQAMADLAVDLLGADKSTFGRWDADGTMRIVAARGFDGETVALIEQRYREMRMPAPTAGSIPELALIEDVADHPRGDPELGRIAGVTSVAALSVAVNGELYGFFQIGYRERHRFTAADGRLFDQLASRAGLAIQNALSFEASATRAEELAASMRQLEALQRADAALHQSLRLQDVYEAMVDLATDLAGADRSLLLGWNDQERLHAYAVRGVGEAELVALNDIYHKVGKEVFAGRRPEILVMGDVPNDRRMNPEVRKITPARSTVDIPIVVDGALFGLFVISWTRPRAFTDDDRKLFETLATRAAVAIQNAQLYEQSAAQAIELAARVRQLEAVRAIAANLTVDRGGSIYDELAEQVVRATSALACTIQVIPEDGPSPVRMVGTAGIPAGFPEALDEAYALGAPSQTVDAIKNREGGVLRNGRAVQMADDRFAKAREIVADARWDTLVSVPIVYREEPLGMLLAGYPANWEEDEKELAFLRAIADQGAIAMANANLLERASTVAALEERQRLARELHDSVSQALYGIALGAKTARKRLVAGGDALLEEAVDYVMSLAEAGLTETRALIFELIPESLENEGLIVAIKRHAAAIQARYQLPVHPDLCDEPQLPIKTKEAIYRITQESLNNVAKHAHAANAYVRLAAADGELTLEVRDDGDGFDPAGDFPGHFGLQSMTERARRIGGRYKITSSPGNGATVTLTVPLA